MQLYHSKRLGPSDLIAKFTVAPARLLGLASKGHLGIGADGDVTIFDPEREWVFDPAKSPSKSRNTPFGGWRLKGRATAVVVRGGVAFDARSEP